MSKKSKKSVKRYSLLEVLESFDKPIPPNPHHTHYGLKGDLGWCLSIINAPDKIDGSPSEWTAVNGYKTHFRTADGEHHIQVQDSQLIYWRQSDQDEDEEEVA